MRNNQTTLLVIQLIVVAFVCLVILILILSYFKQRKQMIQKGSLDDEIIRENEEKKTRKYKAKKITGNVFSGILIALFIGIAAIGAITRIQHNLFPVGDTTVLLVESSSMASKNKVNKYLEENHLNNQIDLYDLIVVNKIPQEDNIQLYDIVIYKKGNRYIVHRVIDIEEKNAEHPNERYFKLRGDANGASDANPVKFSEIVGYYSDNRIPVVGFFIAFLQSPLGLLALVISLLSLIFTPIGEKMLNNAARDRLLEIYKSKESSNVTNILYLNASGESDNPNYFNRVLHLLDHTVVTVQDKELKDISEDKYIELNENVDVFDENERQHFQRLLDSKVKEVNYIDPVIVSEEKKVLDIAKRSFVDKLRLSKKEVKDSYNEIKHEALMYGLKPRMSFSGETFRLHKKTYIKITISGKSLKIFFALNAKDYEDSTIPLIDYSFKKSKAETPSALWIKSDLAVKRAKFLINELCEKDGLKKTEVALLDSVSVASEEKSDVDINEVKENSKFSLIILKKSFTEKLIASSDDLKKIYNNLKSTFISYGLKPRMSFSGETFRLHKKTYAKITISGKSLKVFYALNPKDYEDSTIPLLDYSHKPSKAETPSALWIKSGLAYKRALILIDNVCSINKLKQEKIVYKDWVTVSNKKKEIIIQKTSFADKLKKANEELLTFYKEIKEEAYSFGLKSRLSFSGETFRLHKKTFLKITISGKSLKVFYALNPKDYEDSTIPLLDYSHKPSKAETPSALWVKSPLALKRARELVRQSFVKNASK